MHSINDKKTIVIAEDNDEWRNYLQFKFEAAGYTVIAAANGKFARDYFEKHTVDVVLTDINMPLVSGLELFLFLHRERPIVPVFIMTGDDRLISRFKKINLGAADYFLKPCTGINLVEKISEKLLRD